MLEALPVNTGLAFVVVQHLDPTHASLLPELLARATRMAVLQVTEVAGKRYIDKAWRED